MNFSPKIPRYRKAQSSTFFQDFNWNSNSVINGISHVFKSCWVKPFYNFFTTGFLYNSFECSFVWFRFLKTEFVASMMVLFFKEGFSFAISSAAFGGVENKTTSALSIASEIWWAEISNEKNVQWMQDAGKSVFRVGLINMESFWTRRKTLWICLDGSYHRSNAWNMN